MAFVMTAAILVGIGYVLREMVMEKKMDALDVVTPPPAPVASKPFKRK